MLAAVATTLAMLLVAVDLRSNAATPEPVVVWQGVTLGESTADVLARMGAPASRRKGVMGSHVLEFPAESGVATLALTENGGVITAIRLIVSDPSALRNPPRDPFGVLIGDTADRLTQLRGSPQRYDDEGGGEFTSYYGGPSEVRWAYGLKNDVVHSIAVLMPFRVVRATGAAAITAPTPRPSNAPTPPPPDASDVTRAIRVTLELFAADPQFEFTYVRAIQCGTDHSIADHYIVLHDEIFNANRRNFSRIDAQCPSTGEKRTFYFDITDVFGRGER